MAQLPPKIPPSAMIPNPNCSWPPPAAFLLPSATEAPPLPSWVDEFLHLSAARRSHHRRSVSDSVAFLDDPASEFDPDQLLSIFSDDVVAPAPSSSSPSDHNSANGGDDDDKTAAQKPIANEAEEAQSAWQTGTPQPFAGADTVTVDPKRVKRILANRQSAQRSRVKKLEYISELERSVTTLQSEVSALSPRVAFLDQQRSMLTLGNSHLKQRIAALAQDEILKDAHQEALNKEIDRLRHVYQQQNLTTMPPPPPPPPPPTAEPTVVSTEKELVTS